MSAPSYLVPICKATCGGDRGADFYATWLRQQGHTADYNAASSLSVAEWDPERQEWKPLPAEQAAHVARYLRGEYLQSGRQA